MSCCVLVTDAESQSQSTSHAARPAEPLLSCFVSNGSAATESRKTLLCTLIVGFTKMNKCPYLCAFPRIKGVLSNQVQVSVLVVDHPSKLQCTSNDTPQDTGKRIALRDLRNQENQETTSADCAVHLAKCME